MKGWHTCSVSYLTPFQNNFFGIKLSFPSSSSFFLLNPKQIEVHACQRQPLSAGTSVSSSHFCALECWITVNKDVLNEFDWLFELQSRISQMWGNEGSEIL